MRAPRDRLLTGAIAALVVGLVLNLLFDATATRIVGVVALLAFVVLGTFRIATPDYLGRDDDPDGDL